MTRYTLHGWYFSASLNLISSDQCHLPTRPFISAKSQVAIHRQKAGLVAKVKLPSADSQPRMVSSEWASA